MGIIGYIHICQKGEWKRSFNMLINSIKHSALYDSTSVIRIGVINDKSALINDPILKDSKFQVMYLGKSSQYERPTLLHMRASANTDPADTLYYYLHTKGLRHFGKKEEPNVISWINLMLYWNIIRWKYATEILRIFSTYGCEFMENHYSGNFWWATAKHIKLLPNKIESFYVAPEYWICTISNKAFCAYKSDFGGGELYSNVISPDKYKNLTNKEAYMTNLKFNNSNSLSKVLKIDMNGINKTINNSTRSTISNISNASNDNASKNRTSTRNKTESSAIVSSKIKSSATATASNKTKSSAIASSMTGARSMTGASSMTSARSMTSASSMTGTRSMTGASSMTSASSMAKSNATLTNKANITTLSNINNFSRKLNNVKTMHKLV